MSHSPFAFDPSMTGMISAELTLLVLEESAWQSDAATRFGWHSMRQEVNREDLIRLLAELDKPVRCSAVVRSGLLLVEYENVDAASALEQAENEIAALWGALVRSGAEGRGDPSLLVRGRSSTRLLPWREIKAWLRDYRLNNCSLWLKVEHDKDLRPGVDAVLAFGGPPTRLMRLP